MKTRTNGFPGQLFTQVQCNVRLSHLFYQPRPDGPRYGLQTPPCTVKPGGQPSPTSQPRVSLVSRRIVVIARPLILMVVPRAADADRETRAVQINRHVGTKVMSKDQNASFGSCRSEARGWTPYDFWRRTHAIHHATSGNLDRRGTGDIDTLTVHEYLALSPWRPSIFVHRSTSAASRAHACWLATLAQRDGNQRRHRSSHRHHDMASRRRSLRARASTDHTARGFDRSLAVLCPAPIRGYRLGSLLVGTARARRDAASSRFYSILGSDSWNCCAMLEFILSAKI
jgi:hypothetical protein